jgi:hypothetical protein
MTTHLKAVLLIVNASPELRRKVLPFIYIRREEIDWDGLVDQDLTGGTQAALVWIQCIWSGETVGDLIGRANALDETTRKAVLKALAILWAVEEEVGG